MTEVYEYFYLLSIAYIFTVKLLVPLFHNTSCTQLLAYNACQTMCKEIFICGHECCRNNIMFCVHLWSN